MSSPGSETHLFTYHPPIWRDTSGLLASMRDPRGGQYTFTYDTVGQLLTDTDPSGGGWGVDPILSIS